MRSSIGFGAYDGFGYANEPQWGLFNPPQSLFKSDPTLYDSLFATNRDQEEGPHQARAKTRANQNPGLPNQVGPRKAWQRDVKYKEVGSHNRMGGISSSLGDWNGLGTFGKSPKACIAITIALAGAIGFFVWKKNN